MPPPRPSLEVRDLRLVWAITETAGATAAGKQLGLSQSAVSHQLRLLEQRFGYPLFRREGKKLVGTDASARLYDLALRVVPAIGRVDLELSERTGRVQPVRLSAQCHTSYRWLPLILPQWELLQPGSPLELYPELGQQPLKALREKTLDLALTIGEPRHDAISSCRLFEDHLVVVAGGSHRLSGLPSVSPEALQKEPAFLFDVGHQQAEHVREHLFPSGGTFSKLTYLPIVEAIIEMVAANLGLSVVPRWTVQNELADGRIVELSLEVGPLSRVWHAAWLRHSLVEQQATALVSLLKDKVASQLA